METVNEIYNHDFSLGRRTDYSFPDGWQKAEGGPGTRWIWHRYSDAGEIEIINPQWRKAGIRQQPGVYVPVGGEQRWLIRVCLRSEGRGTRIYVRLRFMDSLHHPIGALEFNYRVKTDKTEYKDIVVTPAKANAALVEVGLKDKGTLHIEKICFEKLYPLSSLRLDEKGRVSVRDVEAVEQVGKIDKIIWPVQAGVKIMGSKYVEEYEEVVTDHTWRLSSPRDVSQKKVSSLAVFNQGLNPALVKLSISPDGVQWLTDTEETLLAPGEKKVLVANFFLKYNSVGYRSLYPGKSTTLAIWYEAQA